MLDIEVYKSFVVKQLESGMLPKELKHRVNQCIKVTEIYIEGNNELHISNKSLKAYINKMQQVLKYIDEKSEELDNGTNRMN